MSAKDTKSEVQPGGQRNQSRQASATQCVADDRYVTFPTMADVTDEEENLLNIVYDDLPTFPVRPSYRDNPAEGNLDTFVVNFDPCTKDPYHPTSMPIYQTATFQQPSIERFGPYDYTRSGNPTRTATEEMVAALEGAHAAFAFASGMAAVAAMTHLCQQGEEVICCADIYGGTYRLLSRICSRHGITAKFVDSTDLDAVKSAIGGTTKILHLETPSNPMMRISDVVELEKICHSRGVLLSIDSTMMSPYLMKPLLLGADIVIQSATKFLGGHSDVTGGFVCCRTEDLSNQIAFYQNAEGTALAPFESWLMLRGLKTLAIRVDRAQANALRIATELCKHPLVTKVHYAGLRDGCISEAQYELHKSQCQGGGSVISIETDRLQICRIRATVSKNLRLNKAF
eukprot:Platyproteum_vivax@DN5123_c0_g1_i1.p1